MELGYRLILYILIANVGFMIFSLAKKGIRIYLGYLLQLMLLLLYMIFMVGWGNSGLWAVFLSIFCLCIVVLVPLVLQKQIERLISEQRFSEIEPLAKWKVNLAWSEMNLHMLHLARAIREIGGKDVSRSLRALLGKGEPFDTMTRLFIAMIHFHLRQFEKLIDDLIVPEKSITDYSFDELLYIVRGYLETGKYFEAISAQHALEKAAMHEDADDQRGNLLVNRMLFFAFLGWRADFEKLVQTEDQFIASLPCSLKDFWHGVAAFNSGAFDEGQALMRKAVTSPEEGFPEIWIVWMQRRLSDLGSSKESFSSLVLPKLAEIKESKRNETLQIIAECDTTTNPAPSSVQATNLLTIVFLVAFFFAMFSGNPEDMIDLVSFGANSGTLVKTGEWFRLLTCLFLHLGWLHLLMNIIALRYFGPPLETAIGRPLFLGVFFFSGLTASLASAFYHHGLSVGASGAVLGLLSAIIALKWTGNSQMKAVVPKGSMGAMIFILIINVIIGSVEKGVDNVAHLGGLTGGIVIGMFISCLLRFSFLRKIGEVFSLIFILLFIGFSGWQFFSPSGKAVYPPQLIKMEKAATDSSSIQFGLPQNWTFERESGSPGKLPSWLLLGPIGERVEITFGEMDESPVDFINHYSEERTRSIVDMAGCKLDWILSPKKILIDGREFQQAQWRFFAGSRPFIERDYFHLDGKKFVLVQCLLPSNHDDLYNPLLNALVASIKTK